MNTVGSLRRLFFYQSDHHAEQWRNKAGEVGYSPACDNRFIDACKERSYLCDGCADRAPTALTDERLQQHLDGKITLGAYQLRSDGTVGWLCIDVDVDQASDHARGNAKRLTLLIHNQIHSTGLPVYVEFTGNKGFHVWLFCPNGCLASHMRRLGQWAVSTIMEAEGEFAGLHTEVFPKQDVLDSANDYGNLVKVPLGVHKKTGKRCVFADTSTWRAQKDQFAYLTAIETATAEQISQVITDYVPEDPKREVTAPGNATKRLPRLAKATRDFISNGADVGERNDRLFKAAADMAGNGYDPEDIEAALLPIALESGIAEREALSTLKSATRKPRNPSVPAQVDDRDHYELMPDNSIYHLRAKPIYARGQRIGMDWIPTQVTNFSAAFAREIVEMDGEDSSAVYVVGGQAPDRRFEVEISAEEFRDERACRSLVGANAGARAIIYNPKHLPMAIQELSNGFAIERRYLSTGWQHVNGILTFLTPGAAPGLCDVEAECRRYHVAPGDTQRGIRALTDGLLEAFPHKITYLAVAHAFLPPLYRWMISAKRYALHLVGETGSLKTAYACALLSLYGPEYANEEPTEKWNSTWKKIEVLGHEAKDVLFLVDDYKPRYVKTGDFTQLIHNYSESRGRGRLNRDSSIQATKWIRGALISTGEDIPESEASVIARMLIIRMSRPIGQNEQLSLAQRESAHLNAVMYAYTAWLTQTMPGTEAQIEKWLTEWRDKYIAQCPAQTTNPGRLAANVAQNRLAFWMLSRWLISASTWTEAQADERLAEYDAYATELITEMAERISKEKASNTYLTAIRALVDSGEMVLLDRNKIDSLTPFLGWKDNDWIYLLPDVAYQAAERWHRAMGGSLGFTRRAIEEQLLDDGLLDTNDESGRRRTTKVIRVGPLGTKTVRVLKVLPSALEEQEQDGAMQETMLF